MRQNLSHKNTKFSNSTFYLTLENILPNLSQLWYVMAFRLLFDVTHADQDLSIFKKSKAEILNFTWVHKSKCFFFHLVKYFGIYSLWGRRVEIKPSLIKADLFTTSFMPQKSADGNVFLFRSGNLRMPETAKGRLVITFFFALSNTDSPLPKERSVTESSWHHILKAKHYRCIWCQN